MCINMKLGKLGITIILTILLSISPCLLFAQGQSQSILAGHMVTVAEKAAQQIRSLIKSVQSTENTEKIIEAVSLGMNMWQM
jgi:hypothetical protein